MTLRPPLPKSGRVKEGSRQTSKAANTIATPWSDIGVWVFDLDNTLYPGHCDLFSQIDARMTAYVAQKLDLSLDRAHALQMKYYHDHGATLTGLMDEHGTEPHEFLKFVHDIDLSNLARAPRLRDEISALEGRKLVFTNGSQAHAERVLQGLGLDDLFDSVFAIEHTDFVPKPAPQSFSKLMRAHHFEPHHAAFFDDLPRNLATAHDLGFRTVWVEDTHRHATATSAPLAISETNLRPFAHHKTADLKGFLSGLREAS